MKYSQEQLRLHYNTTVGGGYCTLSEDEYYQHCVENYPRGYFSEILEVIPGLPVSLALTKVQLNSLKKTAVQGIKAYQVVCIPMYTGGH